VKIKSPAPARLTAALFAAAALACTAFAPALRAQSLGGFEKKRGQMMAEQVKLDIKKNYFDPGFRGVDLEAVFKAANEKIERAVSNEQVMGIIAQAVLELDDSHTVFVPPQRQASIDYGFNLQLVGDDCYVTEVKKGSDAEAKGLKVGDQVLLVNQYQPARLNYWKLYYLFYLLRPQPGLSLGVRGPDGAERQIDVLAKVKQRKRLDLTAYVDFLELVRESENAERDRTRSHRLHEEGAELAVWKMPAFNLEPAEVDSMMNRAAKSKALILDLRGNGGGYEVTLLRLIGNFFDADVRVGELQTRKESKPLVAKSRGGDGVYKGKLIVLVDGESGSSSEVFARTVQLQKRGAVIGDRTAGAVMRARYYQHEVGLDVVTFYGANITEADLKMSDGKSLEKTGVTPDEIRLPTGADLAAKRDPVLAHAASLAGVKMGAEKAGALFPERKT
jgi:C-terminal processing protease CtpA/Prc